MNFKVIAQTLIQRQMRIKPGEIVRINGGTHNLAFLEEIVVEVSKAGGFPMLHLSWESLSRRLMDDVPLEHFSLVPHHRVAIEKMTDCHISLPGTPDPRAFGKPDYEKIKASAASFESVHEAIVARGARRIGIGFPTRELAEVYGVDFETYSRLFWDAVIADPESIFDLCHRIRERLLGADHVRVVSPAGTELVFSVKSRRVNMDDGVISQEDLESGDVTANLPYGEVYVAPIEETVEGESCFPVIFSKGQRIENLRLRFVQGEMVESSATLNHHLFLEAMELNAGDKNFIGEFGIGTNPAVREPMGDTLLDEKIFGSIHLALGENRGYGGKNNSTLHWDMIMLQPTVFIDGKPFLDQGNFVL